MSRRLLALLALGAACLAAQDSHNAQTAPDAASTQLQKARPQPATYDKEEVPPEEDTSLVTTKYSFNPLQSKKDVLVKQIEADIKGTFFSDDTKANGLGWMTKDKWEKTTAILLDQGAMKQAINVDAAFANQFVVAAKPLKR